MIYEPYDSERIGPLGEDYWHQEYLKLVRYAGLLDRHASLDGAPLHLTREIGEARKALSDETRKAIEDEKISD